MKIEEDKLGVMALSVGAGLLGGFLFPSIDGPLDIFKMLREVVGKPFSCALCSGFWSTAIFISLLPALPVKLATAIGSAGWVLLIHHVSGYNPIYEGMDSE